MSSKSSAGKPEVKPGAMKSSASAPSSLPSANASHKRLFDHNAIVAAADDDDDLFAPAKELRYCTQCTQNFSPLLSLF